MTDARTALAQAMRIERIGETRYPWSELDDSAQEDLRRRADHLLRLLRSMGYAITRIGDERPGVPSSAEADLYVVGGNSPEIERLLRRAGDDLFHFIRRDRRDGNEDVLLTMSLDETDVHADRVLAGDPGARELPAISTRLAASTIIRKLHGART